MPTRVLHLIKGLGPGGAEQLLLNQARATSAADLEFHVAYLVSWKNHLVVPLEAAGWTTHCLRSDRPWDLRWVYGLGRMLRTGRYDVVHGHSPLVSVFARIMIRLLPAGRRPLTIYTEHNEWGRHRGGTRLLNRATIRLEDQVLAVSEGVRESMPADLEVDVLIHGIDVSSVASLARHRDEVRAELGIAAHETVIGIVANFRREKAYDVLLEAAARVIADRPDVRFVSVGQGPLEAEIRAHHERLALGDRFLILGYRDDANRIMSSFDVFTLSSHHEGLPVSLMEAMALQLPVVATTVGGIEAAVADWPAILVEPGDSDALAGAYLTMAAGLDDEPSAERPVPFDARSAASALAQRYLGSSQ